MDNIIRVFEGMASVMAVGVRWEEWRGGLRVGRLMGWMPGWEYLVENAAGRKKQEGLGLAGREPRALSPPVKTSCGHSGGCYRLFLEEGE